jgi:selenium-dependent xanthine dehydrogenase
VIHIRPAIGHASTLMPEIHFSLNGKRRRLEVREDENLLDALRSRCGITSIKNGCKPQGQCGCCLVLIDGKAKVSCASSAIKANGREIVTLEGVNETDRQLLARSFVAAAGLQCGFCIPGLALRAIHLVRKNPAPNRVEIAKAIDVHLCRCTGYVKILDAIELFAKAKRGEATPELTETGGVGSPLKRYQGEALTLGERAYVDDLVVDGMLHGALVLSQHARAEVLAISTEKANAHAGVKAVFTANDISGKRFNGLIYADWPCLVAVGEEVRCVGDVLAVVVAEDEYSARQAAKAVEVSYRELPALLDPVAATADDAPQVSAVNPNLLGRSSIEVGDTEQALNTAAHLVEGTFHTQRIEHLFLEPESALALPRKDGIHLYSQGQGIFDDRLQISRLLGIAEDDISVELVPNGGAFGGKEDMTVQAHAALAAYRLKRPVKVTLSREESIRIHPKRHPITMHYRVACDEDGILQAVSANMVGDTGAYASVGTKVLERAAGHACGPYRVPNVTINADAVHTNNPPCGAMRGFGANQAHFAMESCLDMLADKAGVDAWEIRWRNALNLGDSLATGQVLDKSVGIKATLRAIKPHYQSAQQSGAAVGIACGIKNTGIGNGALEWGKCRLVIEEDLTISLYNGYTEMGQGLLTILIQFAVEVTGLPANVFRPKVDSTYALACGQTTGSRATLFAGKAVKSAAEKLKVDLDAGADLAGLAGRVYAADILVDDTTRLGDTVGKVKIHTAYSYATQLCILDDDGKVARMVAAHDVGRVVNPQLCEGQIQGSLHMGLGYALSEELPCNEGMPATFKLRELGALRARDMPLVEVILVEEPEPEGPFGAKGVGEIGLVPTAAAVANACSRFDGIRRFRLPMKDTPAGKAISVGRIRPKRDRG